MEELIQEFTGAPFQPPPPYRAPEPITGAAVTADDETGRHDEQLRLLREVDKASHLSLLTVAESFRRYHEEIVRMFESLTSFHYRATHEVYTLRVRVETQEICAEREEAPYP